MDASLSLDIVMIIYDCSHWCWKQIEMGGGGY